MSSHRLLLGDAMSYLGPVFWDVMSRPKAVLYREATTGVDQLAKVVAFSAVAEGSLSWTTTPISCSSNGQLTLWIRWPFQSRAGLGVNKSYGGGEKTGGNTNTSEGVLIWVSFVLCAPISWYFYPGVYMQCWNPSRDGRNKVYQASLTLQCFWMIQFEFWQSNLLPF